MSSIRKSALFLATVCLLADRAPQALPQQPDAAQPHLKLVVMVSRHGVRSPTWTQARLDSYSALPWPKWSVPPGNLTARGHQLLTLFGSYDRIHLAAEGLLAQNGCADAAAIYIYADSDQRTIESGHALAQGLFPDCPPLPLHGLPEGENDSLFHPATNSVAAAEADKAFTQLSAELKQSNDTTPLVNQIQQLLRGCAPQVACKPSHAPQALIIAAPTAVVRGKGDHIVELDGPLPQASTFAEDFLLEYADGMKMNDVGWGNVDEPELRRLLSLHTEYFQLMHRTPQLAQIEASNIVFHILRTLEQGTTGHPIAGAVGPPNNKLVLLVGHDTNLAGIAQLLGLHWTLDGRADDTVPGTKLAFELWQDARGAYSVRLAASAQTLPQQRGLQPLTPASPPATQIIKSTSCHGKSDFCTWEEFKQLANAAIDSTHVIAEP